MSKTPAAAQDRRTRTRILGFFALACTTAGCMFVFKLHEFLRTIKRDELVGFAFDPITIYGFVAGGFMLLLCWAFFSGQFRDVERAKYELFERFDRQERAERRVLGGPEEYLQ